MNTFVHQKCRNHVCPNCGSPMIWEGVPVIGMPNHPYFYVCHSCGSIYKDITEYHSWRVRLGYYPYPIRECPKCKRRLVDVPCIRYRLN